MPSSTGSALTILVVDDESSVRAHLAALLDLAGHRVIEAHNANWALELFERHQPDLVLLDVVMPAQDGYWLARQLRERETGKWTPIIFLSGRDHEDDLARGIEAGGDDYLVKPISATVLAAKMRAMRRLMAMQGRLLELSAQLRASNQRLQHLSEHDPLTRLLNRRGFDERLASALSMSRRTHLPLTLMLCDLDHFKAYNDNLGHTAGDACLRRVGELIRQMCRRPGDQAARYGGEEFALILPDTPKSGAMTLARAMQRVFEQAAIAHPGSPISGLVTLSGGITTCIPQADTTLEGMLMRADEALYVAKAKGRNRFFSFEMQLDSMEQLSGSMHLA
ncbi:MAG: diguanylate cyclase [Pseudomonadota bacterium]|nr:diguanylate cyclase [Pseudomonadota bacterium]